MAAVQGHYAAGVHQKGHDAAALRHRGGAYPERQAGPDARPTLLTQRKMNMEQYPRQNQKARKAPAKVGRADSDPAPKHSSATSPDRDAPAPGAAVVGHTRSDGFTSNESAGKGVISLLQEFVQCSKHFTAPQHRPILQWSFDQRMADFTTLEFRAMVAFVLDGVPHHVAGTWHPNKKIAQRDAAERALSFFITVWGEALLKAPLAAAAAGALCGSRGSAAGGDAECQVLEEYCARAPICAGSGRPQWSSSWDASGRCCATVEVEILGVVHKFAGIPQQTEAQARTDAARRVLWYLRCPGYEGAFELDHQSPAATAKEIPSPPANWASDSSENDAMHIAERKTVLMRVQNRLQQAFAGQLRPGQGVWEWTYETDGGEASWPPRCRATVRIPAAERSFTGSWSRGQREAQISASHEVTAFLDAREERPGSSGTPARMCSGESF